MLRSMDARKLSSTTTSSAQRLAAVLVCRRLSTFAHIDLHPSARRMGLARAVRLRSWRTANLVFIWVTDPFLISAALVGWGCGRLFEQITNFARSAARCNQAG